MRRAAIALLGKADTVERSRKPLRRRVAALVLGATVFGIGFSATPAWAGCGVGTSTHECGTPGHNETVVAGALVQKAAATIDGVILRGRIMVMKAGLPDPGTVSIPSVGGVRPRGPVGPSPIGDGLKIVSSAGTLAFQLYDNAVRRLPGGGDVGIPSVGPISPRPPGPGPIGDELHRLVGPVCGC